MNRDRQKLLDWQRRSAEKARAKGFGRSSLRPGGTLKPGGPLRPVSKARAKEQRQRVKVLKAMRADEAVCQRCHATPATDPHEVVPRSKGGSVTDPANIRLICRKCHLEIHAHPAAAKRDGWLA